MSAGASIPTRSPRVGGTASNLIFLALLGAGAEQVVSRTTMTLCYLAAGLTGQVAGMLWQPVGAGNSVAVCGLAGLVAWSLRHPRMPGWAGSAVALWLSALLATWRHCSRAGSSAPRSTVPWRGNGRRSGRSGR